jgi:Predicted integral membrane protein (DUF2269)
MSVYPYVEFVHIAAVVLWLGGGSMSVFSAIKAELAHNAADFARVLGDTVFFSMRLFVPAGLVAFACGLAMAYLAELFSELWISIGIAGFAVTFLTGALVIRPRAEKLLPLIRSGAPAADVFGPGREIIAIAKFDYVMLFTIVSDMVLKPGPTDTAVLAAMAVVVVGAGVVFLRPLLKASASSAAGGAAKG